MPLKRPGELSVAILGAGPSAAFAAMALYDLDVHNTHIYSKEIGLPPSGNFYVHWVPPSVEERHQGKKFATLTEGTERIYQWKQYQYTSHLSEIEKLTSTSFPADSFTEGTYWDYHDVGAYMLSSAQHVHTDWEFKGDRAIAQMGDQFDIVFSSFPTFKSRQLQQPPQPFPVVITHRGHPNWDTHLAWLGISHRHWNHWVQTVMTEGDSSPVNDLFPILSLLSAPSSFVVYSGRNDVPWVRLSVWEGYVQVEYPVNIHNENPQLLVEAERLGFQTRVQWNLHPLTKLYTEQIAENIHQIGRFGRWDTKMLSHDNYSLVSGLLREYTTNE